MVLLLGLEPRLSTNLVAMLGYKPRVLPIKLKQQERTRRINLTFCISGTMFNFNNLLCASYGAVDGARSRNNQIGNLELYQLSYYCIW